MRGEKQVKFFNDKYKHTMHSDKALCAKSDLNFTMEILTKQNMKRVPATLNLNLLLSCSAKLIFLIQRYNFELNCISEKFQIIKFIKLRTSFADAKNI